MQVIKRRLVGKEGSERVRELRSILADLPNYRSGPYADIRKWVNGELEATRIRSRVVHRDSISVRREGAAQIALVGAPNTGKSSLLQALSSIQIKTGDYAFTTTRPVPALTRINGVLVQLVEIPGLIAGGERGPRRRSRADRRPARGRRDRLLPRGLGAAGRAARGARGARSGRRREALSSRCDQGGRGAAGNARPGVSGAGRRRRLGAGRREPGGVSPGRLAADGPRPRLPPLGRRARGGAGRAAASGDGARRRRLDPPRARRSLRRRARLGPVRSLRRPARGPRARARRFRSSWKRGPPGGYPSRSRRPPTTSSPRRSPTRRSMREPAA